MKEIKVKDLNNMTVKEMENLKIKNFKDKKSAKIQIFNSVISLTALVFATTSLILRLLMLKGLI